LVWFCRELHPAKTIAVELKKFANIAAGMGNVAPVFLSSHRRIVLATRQEFSNFLAETERRAYKQALFAVRDEHIALDIVQDSMTKLVEKYFSKPVEELPLLFQRILQNTIRDFYRRQKTRSLWTTLFSAFSSSSQEKDNDDSDPLETLQCDGLSNLNNPHQQLEQSQLIRLLEKAIETLPARQREAFLLRYWEEMDVAETAKIMGCSEGSVKTHCSRATHALAEMLKKDGIEL
jgi:RNA polymerase sigma-70 factor (ECF subfamily)